MHASYISGCLYRSFTLIVHVIIRSVLVMKYNQELNMSYIFHSRSPMKVILTPTWYGYKFD